ncbi:5'-nucleotidase domain-containing protein 1 [Saguinus oedipus]|uniref:5'-nucleotidase domain-containing protein 1 n=1 Tax=Saguinus oedipus TaxID=9490 RepID=A0ABQ9THR2_SAGOE|nr:5'-nucleotidase domain-containing protein 1 [Saguinus oedipus]
MVRFDLDHTVCHYSLPESAPLIYNNFAQFLVKEKRYDKELLDVTPEDWDFCCKGLALDLEDGNFLKLADNGTVLRASHSTRTMIPAVLAEAYDKKEWKPFLLDTGWLVAQESITFTTSTLTCQELFYVPGCALSPGFFSHSPSLRPFRILENDEEQEALPPLDKPGWYPQGNAVHLYELLKKTTGKPEPKVVDFGDSMHSDIFPARHRSHWEIVLILEELRGDEGTRRQRPEESEPPEKKGKCEEPKAKPLNTSSKKWGSVFIDSILGLEHTEDSLVYAWSCKRISTYSTIVIPSFEAITELPLDYKFTRFSSSNSKTAGYYPNSPLVLPNDDTLITK